MVKFSSIVPIALLAAEVAASPLSLGRRQDEGDVACYPYETKNCDGDNGCKCERSTDREVIAESNAARRELLDKIANAGDSGPLFANFQFRAMYPKVWEQWFKTESSLKGQTPTEFDEKQRKAFADLRELEESGPEVYDLDLLTEWEEREDKENNSGWVNIPNSQKWAKEGVSEERLAELAELVVKVDEADAYAMGLYDAFNAVEEEFQPWINEWLEQEEESVTESENEHLLWGVCGADDNVVTFRNTDAAQAHMANGRYIWEIDDFIARLSREEMASGGNARGAQPWPEQYASEYGWTSISEARNQGFGSCRSSTDTCRIFPAESDGHYTCKWFWDNAPNYNGQVGYWVFRTIEGVSHKINFFKKELTENALKTLMKLDTLNKDFEPPEKEEDPAWKWFKFAWGLAGTYIPVPDGLGNLTAAAETAITLIDTIESISNEVKEAREKNAPTKLTSGDLSEALGEIFTTMSDTLTLNLETALGHPDRVNDWESLPSYGHVSDLKTPVGKFLNNPLWLVENDSNALKTLMSATAKNVEHKLIDTKLKSEKLYLTLDTRGGDKFKCDGKGARTINYAGGDKCFRLFKVPGFENKNENRPEPADDGLYEKLDKYGLGGDGLTAYYQSILACYQAKGKDGQLDEKDALVPGGQGPVCFFNLPVTKLGTGSACSGGAHANFGATGNCINWKHHDLET